MKTARQLRPQNQKGGHSRGTAKEVPKSDPPAVVTVESGTGKNRCKSTPYKDEGTHRGGQRKVSEPQLVPKAVEGEACVPYVE